MLQERVGHSAKSTTGIDCIVVLMMMVMVSGTECGDCLLIHQIVAVEV